MLVGIAGISSAHAEATSRAMCYFLVHDDCFNQSSAGCSDADYQEFLDFCDEAHPNEQAIRPKAPNKLAVVKQTPTRTVKKN